MFTPMHQCFTPCINYHEVTNKHEKPSIRIVCDYKDGIEIRLIPQEEINNCKHFKTFEQIKKSRLNNQELF